LPRLYETRQFLSVPAQFPHWLFSEDYPLIKISDLNLLDLRHEFICCHYQIQLDYYHYYKKEIGFLNTSALLLWSNDPLLPAV
jgi:hypothetical protein